MDDQFRGPRTTSLKALDLLRSASQTLLAFGWRVFSCFLQGFLFFFFSFFPSSSRFLAYVIPFFQNPVTIALVLG